LGNKAYTLYCSHKKRGNDADKEMGILPTFSGVLVHDHLKGLYGFSCEHAECNAHILRYLKAAVENKKRKWAQDMIDLLLYAKSGGEKSEVFEKYDNILEAGQKEFLKDETPDVG
jgi:transposase